MNRIIDGLFPVHEEREVDVQRESGEIPLFTQGELRTAARSLRNHRAPGPDGIPAEVLKTVADERPDFLLAVYNNCLTAGVFSTRWKLARLVLIDKCKGDRTSPSSFRPLCMLDTAGKLLE
uniref:Reverse transcriptase domain-containing protein n=1 Tax=Rhodnius prolixus TaxID=13249 RepID=T1HWX9_RHOPR